MKHIFIFLFFLCCFHWSHAQKGFLPDSVLLEKVERYSRNNPQDLLFVHTDKTVYTNNEQIWFSAYLLQSNSTGIADHQILSVALVREDSREVVMQEKYAMGGGLAFGSLLLPDSIPPGDYQMLVSTNVLGKNRLPAASFSQVVTIKSITLPDFEARLNILDSLPVKGGVRVRLSVEFQNAGSKKPQKASIRYHVGKSKVMTAGLDGHNACIFTIPDEQLGQAEPTLFTAVKVNDQVRYLSLKLPEIKPDGVQIRFFPEGGNLVHGSESTVGWETKTMDNLPVSITGILYRNNTPVDTISTGSSGIGRFQLMADRKSRYHVLVSKNSRVSRDTSVALPEILEDGVVLQLSEAVVKDTLALNLSASRNRTVKVLLHNYRDIFASFLFEVGPRPRKLRVSLRAIPKGLATITVVDEQSRPLAERLFFARYDQRIDVTVSKSKDIYSKREKVNLKLKLTDHTGKPLSGIMSVACVQDNRIDDLRRMDIGTYAYLMSELTRLPLHPSGRAFGDERYLENMLLVRGWRRYTWQGMMVDTGSIAIRPSAIRDIPGNVYFNGRRLKRPIGVSLMKDGVFESLVTEKDGAFQVTRDQLLITEGRKIFALVNEKNNPEYSISLQDPFVELNRVRAGDLEISRYNFARIENSTRDFELQSLDNVIALKEVVIKASNDMSLHRTVGANACGDYVCMNHILNCQNHYGSKHNSKPVKGWMYAGGIIYEGCTVDEGVSVFKLDGIYTAREFYGVDEKLLDFPDPQLLSTLFWKPGLITNQNGEAECTFYTGDIPGKFRVVVQGVGGQDVIFGESSLEVR